LLLSQVGSFRWLWLWALGARGGWLVLRLVGVACWSVVAVVWRAGGSGRGAGGVDRRAAHWPEARWPEPLLSPTSFAGHPW